MNKIESATGSGFSFSQLVAALIAVLLLCLAALVNGQPFLYPDTPTYLRGAETGFSKLPAARHLKHWLPDAKPDPATTQATQPAPTTQNSIPNQPTHLTSIDDKIVLAGRSVYYGILLYAAYLTSDLWLAVIVQAICVTYVLQLLLVRLWGLSSGRFLGVMAVLSLLTPLGVYTGLLMPDVFAPLVILAIGVLTVYWRRLSRFNCWALAGILAFGLCAHSSHLALAAVMWLFIVLARLLSVRWRNVSLAGLVVVAACVATGAMAEFAFNKAVKIAMGAPPLRLPHPMARLIDMGPGTAFLKKNCSQSAQPVYAACAFVKNYPTAWDDFLFSTDPNKGAFALADADTKRRISDEQGRFVWDVMRDDFSGVIRGLGADVLRQLYRFRVDVWGYSEPVLAMYTGRVPNSVYAGMQRSHSERPNAWLTTSTDFLVLASIVLSLVWWRRRHLPASSSNLATSSTSTNSTNSTVQKSRSFDDLATIVMVGVIGNAVLCATLASSMDRFQARVVWLIPFLALAVLAGATARRTLPYIASPGSIGANKDTGNHTDFPAPSRSSSSPLLS